MKNDKRIGLGLMSGAGAGLVFIACNVLPVFGPVAACIAGELANGALEDPILLVTGCAGATIAALIQVIEIEIANLSTPSTDAGTAFAITSSSASDGSGGASLAVIPPSPSDATVVYRAHLQRVLDKAKALQAGGAK